MEAKYLPSHVANYLLWKANEEGVKDMTPMKLIKLVYFCYAWHLAIYSKKLFAEHIEAWKYGPVIPSLYHEFKRFGYHSISNYAVEFDPKKGEFSYPIIDKSDDEAFGILDAVWKYYKDKDGVELSKITHESCSPWDHAYAQGENTPMDDKKIVERAKEAIQRLTKREARAAE